MNQQSEHSISWWSAHSVRCAISSHAETASTRLTVEYSKAYSAVMLVSLPDAARHISVTAGGWSTMQTAGLSFVEFANYIIQFSYLVYVSELQSCCRLVVPYMFCQDCPMANARRTYCDLWMALLHDADYSTRFNACFLARFTQSIFGDLNIWLIYAMREMRACMERAVSVLCLIFTSRSSCRKARIANVSMSNIGSNDSIHIAIFLSCRLISQLIYGWWIYVNDKYKTKFRPRPSPSSETVIINNIGFQGRWVDRCSWELRPEVELCQFRHLPFVH